MTYSLANNSVRLVANLRRPGRVYLQVKDASTINFDKQYWTLIMPGLGGIMQGQAITAAMGMIELPWFGPLYAISNIMGGQLDVTSVEGAI